MVLSLASKGIIISKIGLCIVKNLNKNNKTLLTLQDIFKLAEEYNMQIVDLVYFYSLANIFIKTKMYNLVKEIYIDDIRVIVFDPNFSNYKNIIFYFHGGAYCAGSPEIYYNFLKKIDNKINFQNYVLIDYLKLPHYNLNQIINSTFHVYLNFINLCKSKNIIFMGDSAGANLALQITNMSIKNKIKIPNHLICLSPWIISDVKKEYWNKNLNNDYLTPYTINLAEKTVLESTDYYQYNPLFFDYNKFPNFLIRAGSCELILDEIYQLINIIKKSKCNFKYHIVNSMYHSFDLYYTFSKSESPDYDKLINYIKDCIIN